MKTNHRIVKEFLSKHPVNQVFVIEAISRYATSIVENEVALRKSMENSIIHPDAWINAAKDWIEINKRS